LRAGLPVLRHFALGRFENAFVNQSVGVQFLDNRVGGAGGDQRTLTAENVLLDPKAAEVFAYLGHHGGDGDVPDGIKPGIRSGNSKIRGCQSGLIACRKGLADVDQVLTAILQAPRDLGG
jgi:hypothetical protein